MTKDEFNAALERIWGKDGAQTKAAKHLGITSRQVRRYASGESPVKDWVADEITALLEMDTASAAGMDLRALVAVAQGLGVRSGWSAGEAAAGILGAALANARHVLGEETVSEMLAPREPES